MVENFTKLFVWKSLKFSRRNHEDQNTISGKKKKKIQILLKSHDFACRFNLKSQNIRFFDSQLESKQFYPCTILWERKAFLLNMTFVRLAPSKVRHKFYSNLVRQIKIGDNTNWSKAENFETCTNHKFFG